MKNSISAFIVALAFMLGGAPVAFAQWTPSGPIKLMIAFAAGGGADTIARQVAQELQVRHGWEIIPQQVTGGGGTKMAVALKDQPADGTAIGMAVTETFGYNMVSNPNVGYKLSDFTPLTTVAGFQMGVVAKSSKGWKSMHDVIAAAKSGQALRFGAMSPKLADLAYLVGKENGVEFNIIEVAGGKAVMNGVNAGDMDLGFMAGIQAKGVAAGDLVNLASALSVPLTQTPDAPTFADLGVPYNSDGYFIFTAPAGLPKAVREALSAAIGAVVSDPKTQVGGLLQKAFGGAAIIKGRDLESLLAADVVASGKLMSAAQ